MVSGAATLMWEFVDKGNTGSVVDSLSFGVLLAAINPDNVSVAPTVSARLAPVGKTELVIPRFADADLDLPMFTIS